MGNSNTFAQLVWRLYKDGKKVRCYSGDRAPIEGKITECGTNYFLVGKCIIPFSWIIFIEVVE